MPALFVGHGSPMNAIETNHFTNKWKELGATIPKPKAIVGISAHWETDGIFVTGMKSPKTIHDFGGFPRELFEIEYAVSGSQELAYKISKLITSNQVQIDNSQWGLDHGIWSILVHMYPEADIPVVQLSLDRNLKPEQHYNLGKELSLLRDEGILFLCSGNIIHNLRLVDWRNHSNEYEWAKKVSAEVKKSILTKDYASLCDFGNKDDDFNLAINSAEHFIPLLYLLGLSNKNDNLDFFNDEILMGSLSMTGVIIY